jgi:hypothetical protein
VRPSQYGGSAHARRHLVTDGKGELRLVEEFFGAERFCHGIPGTESGCRMAQVNTLDRIVAEREGL